MSKNNAELHVYHREISAADRSSLAVLAEQISKDAAVLDLGLGSGALGRHLVSKGLPRPDGLTYNPVEADLARPHYAHVEVADLEQANLATLFSTKKYDVIVCADVLEHLRQPEQVLVACQKLLKPSGQVLMSVPNVGYAGLLGELIHGEFKYRPEGLLDQTHLRFFTRSSLLRLLADVGFEVVSLDLITKDLPDSEFSVAFDALAPAVSRQLLALPDALTYQLTPAFVRTSIGVMVEGMTRAERSWRAAPSVNSSNNCDSSFRKAINPSLHCAWTPPTAPASCAGTACVCWMLRARCCGSGIPRRTLPGRCWNVLTTTWCCSPPGPCPKG